MSKSSSCAVGTSDSLPADEVSFPPLRDRADAFARVTSREQLRLLLCLVLGCRAYAVPETGAQRGVDGAYGQRCAVGYLARDLHRPRPQLLLGDADVGDAELRRFLSVEAASAEQDVGRARRPDQL